MEANEHMKKKLKIFVLNIIKLFIEIIKKMNKQKNNNKLVYNEQLKP